MHRIYTRENLHMFKLYICLIMSALSMDLLLNNQNGKKRKGDNQVPFVEARKIKLTKPTTYHNKLKMIMCDKEAYAGILGSRWLLGVGGRGLSGPLGLVGGWLRLAGRVFLHAAGGQRELQVNGVLIAPLPGLGRLGAAPGQPEPELRPDVDVGASHRLRRSSWSAS